MILGNNNFSTILYTAIIAFFGAISKEINDKSKDNTESFFIFFAEVILHGFSGWIVGLFAVKYLKSSDIISITIYAGVGGLFGYDLAKVVLKTVLTIITKSNINIDLDELDGKNKRRTRPVGKVNTKPINKTSTKINSTPPNKVCNKRKT